MLRYAPLAFGLLLVACSGDATAGDAGSGPEDAGGVTRDASPARDSGAPSDAGGDLDAGATELPAIVGVGILGDSSSDEYRADDDRGGAYEDVTFNWTELLVRARGLDLGPWSDTSRGEPRRRGYAQNWARSSATSQSLIDRGQHTGLAEQICAGDVNLAVLAVGANDFADYFDEYEPIYDGSTSDAELAAKIDGMVANQTLAARTVLHPEETIDDCDGRLAEMVIVGVADWGNTPGIISRYPDAARRQRVTDAVDEINAALRAFAEDEGVLFVDPNARFLELVPRVGADGTLPIGGVAIDLLDQGNEPHHARLDDTAGHAGTVMNGMVANWFLLEPIAGRFRDAPSPFTEREMLENAGIAPP